MALGPQNIINNKEQIIKILEKVIDGYIQNSESNTIFISCDQLPKFYLVAKELEDLYNKAG